MKKMKMMAATLFCISFSALAVEELSSGELQQREGIFTTKEGKILEGEYQVKNLNSKSSFVFKKGKIEEFSFHSQEKDDLEIEGKFIDNQKYFKGEISVQQVLKEANPNKVKEELSLDGSLEAKEIVQFATEILTKKEGEQKQPSFSTISNWTLQDGEREFEKEVVKKIEKQENTKRIMTMEVTKTEEKQIYSSGKVVHKANSSMTNMEKTVNTQ